MYPVVNGISGSLSCIPFCKAQDSGFHQQTDFPDSRVRIPLHGAIKEVIAGEKLQMAYCDERNKMDGNLPKHNLQT